MISNWGIKIQIKIYTIAENIKTDVANYLDFCQFRWDCFLIRKKYTYSKRCVAVPFFINWC
jgi:hypothetical protein